MFGLGMPEILIILAVALLVVGPKKLPDLAKGLGKGLREFRGAADELKSKFEETEAYNDLKDIKTNLTDITKTVNPKSYLDMETLDVKPSSPTSSKIEADAGEAPPDEETAALETDAVETPTAEAAPADAAEASPAETPAPEAAPAEGPKKFMPPPAKTVAATAPADQTPEPQEKPASDKNE